MKDEELHRNPWLSFWPDFHKSEQNIRCEVLLIFQWCIASCAFVSSVVGSWCYTHFGNFRSTTPGATLAAWKPLAFSARSARRTRSTAPATATALSASARMTRASARTGAITAAPAGRRATTRRKTEVSKFRRFPGFRVSQVSQVSRFRRFSVGERETFETLKLWNFSDHHRFLVLPKHLP